MGLQLSQSLCFYKFCWCQGMYGSLYRIPSLCPKGSQSTRPYSCESGLIPKYKKQLGGSISYNSMSLFKPSSTAEYFFSQRPYMQTAFTMRLAKSNEFQKPKSDRKDCLIFWWCFSIKPTYFEFTYSFLALVRTSKANFCDLESGSVYMFLKSCMLIYLWSISLLKSGSPRSRTGSTYSELLRFIIVDSPYDVSLIALMSLWLIMAQARAVLYSLKPDYTVSLASDPNELARAVWDPSINRTGWNRITVVVNQDLPLEEAYRAAGFIEGYVTQQWISDHFNNFYQGQLNKAAINPSLTEFVSQQISFVEDMHRDNPEDPYWRLANALLLQVRGMHEGYQARVLADHNYGANMPRFQQFYYLTNMGDLNDLLPALSPTGPQSPECNSIIKRIQGDILLGHSTFNIYPLMQRIIKTYQFGSSKNYPGRRLTFTSRPGDLSSKDDFYLLDTGLAVVQTSLNNFNSSNYKFLRPKSLPSWMRAHLASRLATDSPGWATVFAKYRSGTHNNQWTILNYNCVGGCSTSTAFLFEQFYYLTNAQSLDPILEQEGYFASFNVPYSQAIYNVSGYSTDYFHDSRYLAFREANASITDPQSLKKVLRTVDENDLTGGIAPRYDLSSKPFLFGGIDSKVVSLPLFREQAFWAVSGPPFSGNIKPFSWHDWPNVTAHHGQPQVWDFDWVKFASVRSAVQ